MSQPSHRWVVAPPRHAEALTAPPGSGTINPMPTPPESTKNSLRWKLREHARDRWPQLADIATRFRGQFAYVEAALPDQDVMPLMRLRYGGSANRWGFAIYLASSGKYEDSFLPNGTPSGSPEEALDCACGLYLGDPTAWQQPPTN